MKEISVTEVAKLIAEKLAGGGLFLTTGEGNHRNVMTIGWEDSPPFMAKAALLLLCVPAATASRF